MQYYKNTELGRIYAVSEGTIRRWIAAAKEGRLDLQLHDEDGTTHIANTTKNTQIMRGLIEKGKKHTNSRWHRVVEPKKEFYDLYTKRQIVDLITNIEMYNEIPIQYQYFGDGAKWWDEYTNRMSNEDNDNTFNANKEMLASNFANIDRIIEDYDKVNVIDVGVGNGLQIKELLEHIFLTRGYEGKYIGLDISKKLLDITEHNIEEWFSSKIVFEKHERDISFERFDDILIDDDPEKTINVVLLFGGTLENFRSPEEILSVIKHSIGLNSIFLTNRKLDTPEARRFFGPETLALPMLHKSILNNLGIKSDLYEVVLKFDQEKKMRFLGIKPKLDVTIDFKVKNINRRVRLKKDKEVLLWRVWHGNAIETINRLDRCGFSILETSTAHDQQYLLTISKVKITP